MYRKGESSEFWEECQENPWRFNHAHNKKAKMERMIGSDRRFLK